MKTWITNFRWMLILSVLFMGIDMSSLSAAGPITHAALTEQLFRLYPQYQESEKQSFRMGTLFSGVHNLGGLTADQVNFPGVTMQEILNEPSPFIAGMMFHAYVDNYREQFVSENAPWSSFEGKGIVHKELYLKFLEDQVLCASVDKGPWKSCVNYVHPEELTWGIDDAILQKWHYLLGMSFAYQPSTLVFFAYLQGKGLLDVPHEEMAIWYDTFSGVSSRTEVKDYVNALMQMFEQNISTGI